MNEIIKKYHSFQKFNNFEQNIIKAERALNTFNLALNEFYKKKIIANNKLIDLGSGNENLVKLAKKKNIRAKGYDFDSINLEFSKIPEENNSADYVTCISLIEHLKDPSNLLKEVYRILKPEGILIIVTPNFHYCYKDFYDDPTHVNPFTPEKTNATLKLFNFKDIQVLPWIVNKNPLIWKLPIKFFFSRYLLLTKGDSKLPLPNFFKGQSKSILSLAKK